MACEPIDKLDRYIEGFINICIQIKTCEFGHVTYSTETATFSKINAVRQKLWLKTLFLSFVLSISPLLLHSYPNLCFPDKGYQEPPGELDSAIITMLALSGILLIFTIAGSLYILKSYKVTLGLTLCH